MTLICVEYPTVLTVVVDTDLNEVVATRTDNDVRGEPPSRVYRDDDGRLVNRRLAFLATTIADDEEWPDPEYVQ